MKLFFLFSFSIVAASWGTQSHPVVSGKSAQPAASVSTLKDTTGVEEEKKVAQIKKAFTAVNNRLATAKKIEKDLECDDCAEGAIMEGYYSDKKLIKLTARYFGETGQTQEHYYINNDDLFFVLVKDFRYKKTLDRKGETVEENRYYFVDQKLIRWLQPGNKKVASSQPEFKVKDTAVLNGYRTLLKQFKQE